MTKTDNKQGKALMNISIKPFKNQKLRFWSIIAAKIFCGVIALGAVFQGATSETWFSMPSLWFFALIVLPILFYFLVRFYWTLQDRTR
jgi:hypothetical protein